MSTDSNLDFLNAAAEAIGAAYFRCGEMRNRQIACERLSGAGFDPAAWERMQLARSPAGRAADPELARMLDAAACLGMREAAADIQRGLDGFFDRRGLHGDWRQPPEPLRPELVVDNTAKEIAAPGRARQKSKGKRAAARPAGDAA